jgi:hypothetical protein
MARASYRGLLWGLALSLLSALAFLPVFVFFLIPRIHEPAGALVALVLSIMVFLQGVGIIFTVSNGLHWNFDFATLVAVSAILGLFIIAAYTGMFLASFAGRM